MSSEVRSTGSKLLEIMLYMQFRANTKYMLWLFNTTRVDLEFQEEKIPKDYNHQPADPQADSIFFL